MKKNKNLFAKGAEGHFYRTWGPAHLVRSHCGSKGEGATEPSDVLAGTFFVAIYQMDRCGTAYY